MQIFSAFGQQVTSARANRVFKKYQKNSKNRDIPTINPKVTESPKNLAQMIKLMVS